MAYQQTIDEENKQSYSFGTCQIYEMEFRDNCHPLAVCLRSSGDKALPSSTICREHS